MDEWQHYVVYKCNLHPGKLRTSNNWVTKHRGRRPMRPIIRHRTDYTRRSREPSRGTVAGDILNGV